MEPEQSRNRRSWLASVPHLGRYGICAKGRSAIGGGRAFFGSKETTRKTRTGVLALTLLAACTPAPAPAPETTAPGDPTRGEAVFWAGGCGTCHATPGSDPTRPPRLGGGQELVSRYGTFVAPNISPDPVHGIGAWTGAQFAAAMMRGVSPQGGHYYPAFPYTSYARMRAGDVADLWAWLHTLPSEAREIPPHALRFPYENRRLLGAWKRRFLRPGPVVGVSGGEDVARGQYLVEGPGHCGACHTPRTALGGSDLSRWLAGAEALEGPDGVAAPNITPASPFIAEAGIDEIAAALIPAETHAQAHTWGEGMEAVRRNLAHLPASDRRAIAAYLKAIAPRE